MPIIFSLVIVSKPLDIDVAGNWEAETTGDGSFFDKLDSDV